MNQPHNKDELTSLQKRKLMRQSTLISLIGISIAASATIYVVSSSPSIKTHYESAIKPGTDPHLTIAAFSKNNQGKYDEVNSLLNEGEIVIFKASTVNPIHVALLRSVNNHTPSVVFDVLIPPGKNKLLEKAGDKYIYTIDKQDKNLKFCVIYAESRNQLAEQLVKLDSIWPTIPETSCLKLR